MFKKVKQLIYLFFLAPLFLKAQTTTVTGKIENAASDSIELIVDNNYLDFNVAKYKLPLVQNKFKFELELRNNCLATLIYAGQVATLYLEQGDELNAIFNADSLWGSIHFSGKGAANNQFLKLFNVQFADNFSTTVMEEKIKTLGIDAFENSIYTNRAKQKKFYEEYSEKNLLSEKFKKYMEAHIGYTYQGFLLAWPIVNASKSNSILSVPALPKIMLEGLNKKSVSDDAALMSESYRNFLVWFVTYFASEANGFNKFTDFTLSVEKKHMIANEYLKGKSLLYYLARFLTETGEKVNPETVKRIYTQMEMQDKKSDYTLLVKEKLGKWMKTKPPKSMEMQSTEASSEFKFKNLDGKDVSLAAYKGKVVYVDFWASWCGPCRQQFPYSKALHEKLSNKQKKDVVFLYISIDNTEDVWKNAINQLQIEGEHLLSTGGWNSGAAKQFQINSIPRYMLIDKKGIVVNQNASRPSDEETLQHILDLL